MKWVMPWHDPTTYIFINVEPRHGVAHDIPNMLLNTLLQDLIALS